MKNLLVMLAFAATQLLANPYPDPEAVPQDRPGQYPVRAHWRSLPDYRPRAAFEVLRVQFEWLEATDTFSLSESVIEKSGTEALRARAARPDPLGSYRAVLWSRDLNSALGYASIGTGQEFRKLSRSLTFRFPYPAGLSNLEVRLTGENPTTGAMEPLLAVPLDKIVPVALSPLEGLETKILKAAQSTPSVVVAFYADGYTKDRKDAFFQHADKALQALQTIKWPELDRMTFLAVYAPSTLKLGRAQDLGLPVKARDSFLGLYYPYWRKFGRWYNVVYPTSENHFRANAGRVGYDYPIAIIDSSEYWGVGNFNELTALPALHTSFTYLLTHELGHFFGLNEEYEGGGPTELEFAPQISEPWSQNITFLRKEASLKWGSLVSPSTPIPTPDSHWNGSGPFGAYKGGYADSEPQNTSHKPGFHCTMEDGRKFCPVCQAALAQRVRQDTGLNR